MNLKRAMAERLCVSICRNVEGEDEIDGVVIELSAEWCLVADVNGFDADGYWIVRRDTISRLEFTRHDAFRQKLMEKSGLIRGLRPPAGLDISDTAALMHSLVATRRYVIVFEEDDYEWYSWHAAVLSVQGKFLRLRGFDGSGCFEKRVRRIRISEITCIRIASRYLSVYEKAAPYDYDAP